MNPAACRPTAATGKAEMGMTPNGEESADNVGDPTAYLLRILRHPDDQTVQMIVDRDRVQREYGRLFHPENLERLRAEDLKGFLYENNRHWWGIHRHQQKLVADMDHTRDVFSRLLDEERPIVERVDWVEGVGVPKPLPGLGKAVYTPILHVVYPDRYGVWNSIAESAMRRLGLWPAFGRGWSIGQQYEAMSQTMLGICTELGTDLWTLDSLWWRVEREAEPTKHAEPGTGTGGGGTGGGGRARHAVEQFTCERCWMTKPVNLRVTEGEDVCVDCG